MQFFCSKVICYGHTHPCIVQCAECTFIQNGDGTIQRCKCHKYFLLFLIKKKKMAIHISRNSYFVNIIYEKDQPNETRLLNKQVKRWIPITFIPLENPRNTKKVSDKIRISGKSGSVLRMLRGFSIHGSNIPKIFYCRVSNLLICGGWGIHSSFKPGSGALRRPIVKKRTFNIKNHPEPGTELGTYRWRFSFQYFVKNFIILVHILPTFLPLPLK